MDNGMVRNSAPPRSPRIGIVLWDARATSEFGAKSRREECVDELDGRLIACQLLVTGLIARVANASPDPLSFLTDFRDEMRAVVDGVNIAGVEDARRVRDVARSTMDELFSLMKPPPDPEVEHVRATQTPSDR